jgi:hypothetical protein
MSQTLAQYEASTFLRWIGRRAKLSVRVESYINTVLNKQHKTVAQRVQMAARLLEDRVIANLSRPVRKYRRSRLVVDPDTGEMVRQSRTVVDPESRSKSGEFPRADTTRLMKSIFTTFDPVKVEARIGTPLRYGMILETRLSRSFLRRTFNEMRHNILLIVRGGHA